MRIAQIAPIIESVPPLRYGGTERIISALTEELVRRGHQVTLFASGDSRTEAKLVSVYPRSLRNSDVENIYGTNIWSLLNVGLAYQESVNFDVIHDHNSQNNPVSLPLANISDTPVVMTLHGPLDGDYGFNRNGEGYEYFEMYNRPHLVTISEQQKSVAPHLNFAGTVYHGLPMRQYRFSPDHDGYLLFVGRLHLYKGVEEKGLLHAIKVAKLLKMPLYIAAKIDKTSHEDMEYFYQAIKPLLTDGIQFLGEVDEEIRNELMSRAMCVLHPVNFPEPFGLTIIESMACGAPVIGFRRGSVPEIIRDGVSGYVVDSIQEMTEKIKEIGRINRRETRAYALERFSVEKMVDGYEEIYERLLSLRKQRTVQAPKSLSRFSPRQHGLNTRRTKFFHD